ncbi:conjugative transfer protein MobI(A/C) [Vibrio sp. Makdt]|uniref:conjugative transfer protein MobI(A/C) n=1 Tax=Vibrio sp. Makdt TaxID=2998828 RepID=UPI0022CD8951|nr:conjugative transfer protein MobI(A/C) [Vibrio sp. Makdt]MDA0152478.1 conjugative transfer protein MobI(A/C) [Vibrio sp. Makdt]
MGRKRKIDLDEHEVPGLIKVVPPMLLSLNEHWVEIHKQVHRIKSDYWETMKYEVEKLKHRQNSSVAKLPAEQFLKSTFIVYRPMVRCGEQIDGEALRLTWSRSLYMFTRSGTSNAKAATEHVQMNESSSNLMPSYYHPSKFKFDPMAEWQKSFVLKTEKELAHYRVLAYKLQIAAKEITSINSELNKLIDIPNEVQDPISSSQNQSTYADPLMAASEALKKAHDDINAITPEFAELLIETDSETLISYNIDPDVKHMYMRNI